MRQMIDTTATDFVFFAAEAFSGRISRDNKGGATVMKIGVLVVSASLLAMMPGVISSITCTPDLFIVG
jgi:hypothetical protein